LQAVGKILFNQFLPLALAYGILIPVMPFETVPRRTTSDHGTTDQRLGRSVTVKFDADQIEYLERRCEIELRDKSNLLKFILRAYMADNPLHDAAGPDRGAE